METQHIKSDRFRRRHKWILLLLSLLFSAVAAELALRLFVSEVWLLDIRTDAYWKARLRLSIPSDSAYCDIKYDSELGWRMRPLFQRQDVHHNSRGFRAEREFTRKPQGLRILTIGDSFTYGLGVEDNATFSHILGRISGAEVINAGVNGYGVDQAFLMWEREGKLFNPEIVVMGYFVDDFFRNALSISTLPKPHFVYERAHGFRLLGVPTPEAETLASSGVLDSDGQLRVSQLYALLKRRVVGRLGFRDIDGRESRAQISKYLLKRLRDSVAQSGARLLVLIIGHCQDGFEENLWIEKSIVDACSANDIECLNIAAAMREGEFDSFYGPNCHWSERGHRFVAERIVQSLDLVDVSG